jgi:predicted RNA-binding protein YlxR (DUF448 family)
VACRRKADARELLRVVCAPDRALVFDWRRNLGGRGAHVCPSRRCIELAVKRRGFDRTLKVRPRYPAPAELIETARTALRRQIETLVGAASSSGNLVAGTEAARRALDEGGVACLLVADDATGSERHASEATAAGARVHILDGKRGLGALAGRGQTGVLAVLDDRLAAAIGAAIERLAALEGEVPRED